MLDVAIDAPGVSVRRALLLPQRLLHCAPNDAGALSLDSTMLRAVVHGGGHALHLAPDEWLLIGVAIAAPAVPHSLVDVSDRTLGLEITRPLAPLALAAGCPLDLGDTAFPVGACSRTLFGKITVLLWRQAADTWRMDYGRSFDAYACGLLELAAVDAAL